MSASPLCSLFHKAHETEVLPVQGSWPSDCQLGKEEFLLVAKSENGSNQLQFQKLWQELRAINFWDKDYEASESHDFVETAAWEARRRRMREIALELIALNS